MDKMESNPCYGCSNLVYEEINQSVNTSKDEGLERKVAEKNVIDYNQPKMTTSSNKKIVIAIAVCVSLLALSVVAVAALAIVSYKEITTLQSRVQLQGSPLTNTDQESLTQINEQLDSLQNVVNVLNAAVHNITTDVNSLQSAVDTLNTTTMIQFSGDTHLYENCIQENRSCQISQISSGTYSKACNTASLLINSTGYYTTGMRCAESEHTGYRYMDSTTIIKRGNNVHCKCDVIYPYSSSLRTLPTSLTVTCTLIVTRCPLQQNIHTLN